MKQRKQQPAKWNSHSKALCLPHRWTDWTRALREKFKRSWLRQPGLELTLLQPRGPLCLHYHRWQAGTWSLAPNIRLAISPLLEETFWQGTPHTTALIDRNSGARSTLAKCETERREAVRGVLVPQLLSSQTLQRSGNFHSTGIAWDAAAPLARVFARKREQNEDDGTALGNRSREVRQDALALRVVRHYARIEELTHRTLVSARPPATTIAKNVEHREAVLEAAPVSPRGVKGRLGMDTSDFDIEHLTDRVVRRLDGRLIAHQERLGRLF